MRHHGLVVVVALLSLGASFDSSSVLSIPTVVVQAYSNADYRNAINGCSFHFFDNMAPARIFTESDLLITDLTDADKQMLGAFRTPGGKLFGCPYSIGRAIELSEHWGRLPRSGIELLALYNSRMLSEEGLEDWLAATPDMRLETVRRAVNPATGRLYATFQSNGLESLSIDLDKLEGESGTRLLPFTSITPGKNGESTVTTEMRPYQGWRIRVYGERVLTPLVDKVIWREIHGGKPQQGGLCSCQ